MCARRRFCEQGWHDMEKMRVGLIGLGAMGRGVAANLLQKGYDVVAYDVRPEAAAYLAFLETTARGLGKLDDSAVMTHYAPAGK